MRTELDISSFIRDLDAPTYSASRFELGDNAGAITWGNAKVDALALFGGALDRDAFDAFFAKFGAWSDEELAAQSDEECAALMLQFIAGDARECDFQSYRDANGDTPEQWSAEWWPVYETRASEGCAPNRFFRTDDGCIFYDIGN